MKPQLECDAFGLIDEAYAVSLSVTLDVSHAMKLIEDLHSCANKSRDAGMTALSQKMRDAADILQHRLES